MDSARDTERNQGLKQSTVHMEEEKGEDRPFCQKPTMEEHLKVLKLVIETLHPAKIPSKINTCSRCSLSEQKGRTNGQTRQKGQTRGGEGRAEAGSAGPLVRWSMPASEML